MGLKVKNIKNTREEMACLNVKIDMWLSLIVPVGFLLTRTE